MKLKRIALIALSAVLLLSAFAFSANSINTNISASDIISLQQYLLCRSSNITHGDFNDDGDTNVFDLTVSKYLFQNKPQADTPFSKHGKLRVDGANLVDKNGQKYQLYGMSTHGIGWYPQYVN